MTVCIYKKVGCVKYKYKKDLLVLKIYICWWTVLNIIQH